MHATLSIGDNIGQCHCNRPCLDMRYVVVGACFHPGCFCAAPRPYPILDGPSRLTRTTWRSLVSHQDRGRGSVRLVGPKFQIAQNCAKDRGRSATQFFGRPPLVFRSGSSLQVLVLARKGRAECCLFFPRFFLSPRFFLLEKTTLK